MKLALVLRLGKHVFCWTTAKYNFWHLLRPSASKLVFWRWTVKYTFVSTSASKLVFWRRTVKYTLLRLQCNFAPRQARRMVQRQHFVSAGHLQNATLFKHIVSCRFRSSASSCCDSLLVILVRNLIPSARILTLFHPDAVYLLTSFRFRNATNEEEITAQDWHRPSRFEHGR